tara:strand:- start:1044 stop:1202 length:159 start_codon:yes stop_codon:yes gene_type:complete
MKFAKDIWKKLEPKTKKKAKVGASFALAALIGKLGLDPELSGGLADWLLALL